MVFTECYSIFIQLIHIVDTVRYRAMWFDAVRYSSIEVHEKVKFSEKIFVEEAIPSCSLKKEGSKRVKEAGDRSFFSVESKRNVPTDLIFSFVIPND